MWNYQQKLPVTRLSDYDYIVISMQTKKFYFHFPREMIVFLLLLIPPF